MNPLLITLISVVSALVLFFLIFLFLIKPRGKRAATEKFKRVHYAHRGLHDTERAENSLSAFKAAVDAGYGIELDVRLTKDGELVVFHDDTLERMCGTPERVDSRTLSELRELKLLRTSDTLPTFREVLDLVDGKVPLLVELKEDQGKYGVTEAAVRMLADYKGEYMIESFNPLALARVKKLAPEVVRGILSQSYMNRKGSRTPTFFLLHLLLLNVICRPDFIAMNRIDHKNLAMRIARRLFGATTFAWTVRSPEEEKAALSHGFDGVIFENYLSDKKL